MIDRWRPERPQLPPGQGHLYWHVLLGDNPAVQELAAEAHARLGDHPGLHFTPQRWLHMTVLMAGETREITDQQREVMTSEAGGLLADTGPINVSLSRILYHPEAIVLALDPAEALNPLRDAISTAAHTALGFDVAAGQLWFPHITLAYSTADQPANPIITTLGHELPRRELTIDGLTLVDQVGREHDWDWRPLAELPLTSPGMAEYVERGGQAS